MSDSAPDDLSGEIQRLWEKAAASAQAAEAPAALAGSPPSALADAAWETVSILKRRQRQKERDWTQLLETKEKALQALREKQGLLEREAAALRERVSSGQTEALEQALAAQSETRAALSALEEERRRHQEEQKSLKGLLDSLRDRLAVGQAGALEVERRSQAGREQPLREIEELRTDAARRQEELERSGTEVRRLTEGLEQAKLALEATLGELLRERQLCQQEGQEADRARRQAEEMQRHLQELSKLWEEERSQWQSLWERDRAAWQAQREEFASWAEAARREREAWRGEFKTRPPEPPAAAPAPGESRAAAPAAETTVWERLKALLWKRP